LAERNVANKDDIELASRIACGDMLKELGDVARRAEKAGARPQGERLAKAAKAIAKGNFEEAMRLRDEIKGDLESQRTDRHLLCLASWSCPSFWEFCRSCAKGVCRPSPRD